MGAPVGWCFSVGLHCVPCANKKGMTRPNVRDENYVEPTPFYSWEEMIDGWVCDTCGATFDASHNEVS